jgi:PAS domain S-box-containing protein
LKNIFSLFQLDKNQFTLLFFVSAVVLVSINIVSYMNTGDLVGSERKTVSVIKYLETIETLRDHVNDAQHHRELYLASNDKKSLDSYNYSASMIDTLYNKLKNTVVEESTQKLYLDTLSTLIRERFEILNRGLSTQNKKGSTKQYQKIYDDGGEQIHANINDLILRMKSEQYTELKQQISMQDSKSNFTLLIMVIGTVFSIILFGIIFLLLVRKGGEALQKAKPHQLTADELETIVRERTAEISKINTRLYKVIAEHEKTEAALKKSEADLRNLFEQAHDAIIIFTPEDKKVLEVNNRAGEVYGITKENFTGISLNLIFKNIPENDEHIAKTLEKGYYYNFQTVHYKKNGTEMLMEINASVINYRGKSAVLSINRDITERILRLIPLPGS